MKTIDQFENAKGNFVCPFCGLEISSHRKRTIQYVKETGAALLEELRDVDPRTHDEYFKLVEKTAWDHWPVVLADTETHEYSPESEMIYDSIVQGSIQRACERRGWTWRVFGQTPDNEKSHCGEIGKVAPGYEGDYYEQYHEYCIASIEADSPAEALLAAYIAAVRGGEAKK